VAAAPIDVDAAVPCLPDRGRALIAKWGRLHLLLFDDALAVVPNGQSPVVVAGHAIEVPGGAGNPNIAYFEGVVQVKA
jgi:hypothetical protein